MDEIGNKCVFSPDRVYRYTLLHSWRGLLDAEDRIACWIALNPSTADENQLDPTLRRIRGYSMKWGLLLGHACEARRPAGPSAKAAQ